MKLIIRRASPLDVKHCEEILHAYSKYYLDDFQEMDSAWICELAASESFYCLEIEDQNQKQELNEKPLVGLLWLSDFRLPVSCQIHFLIHPVWFRKAYSNYWLEQVIDFVFANYPILKIKVQFMASQTSAYKCLRRLGFYQTGFYPQETLKDGNLVDCVSAELPRGIWMTSSQRNKILP